MTEQELQRRVDAVWGNMAASTNHRVPRERVEASLRERYMPETIKDATPHDDATPTRRDEDATGVL